MCSSGQCNIPGLINGPVGSLVGMGVKALLNGAPIGPRSAEALRTPTEKENIQQFYDKIEAHLKGALQVLQPALEIKRALERQSKSAEPERPRRDALTPAAPIVYYSPQNPSKSQSSACPSRCCGQKKSSIRASEDSSTLKVTKKERVKSTTTSQSSSSIASYKCKKGPEKKCSPCFAGETSSSGRYESKEKSCRSSTSKSKCKRDKCDGCHISLKENTLLAVLPCGHSFCYTCLGKAKQPRCPKCEKSFDMKNVRQISFTG